MEALFSQGICMKGAVLRICPVCTSSSQTRIQPCQANKTKNSSSDLLLEAQHVWPAWAENACRRMSQARHKAVKGLVEALQVTAPRPSAADHMSLFPVRPIDYPSQAALAALTAQWAAAGIWALAILGNATLYEAETEGLTQVGAAHQWMPLTGSQAADCCWALAHARHCTPALHDILDASHNTLAQLNPRQVTSVLWACATLLHAPAALLTSLAARYTHQPEELDRFSPRALATCAWSLAALQQLQHPLFGMLWTDLCGRAAPAFSKPSLLQLHQVQIEAGLSGTDVRFSGSHGMLQAACLAWTKEAQNLDSKQDSSYVKQVKDVALGLGFDVVCEDSSSGYAVDVALPAVKVAIEVDGPSHRSRNTGQALGPTAMKQRHVRAAGWQLLTIMHSDWDLLQSRQQMQHFLQNNVERLRVGQRNKDFL